MQLLTLLPALLISSFTLSTPVLLTYDDAFDMRNTSLANVACSDGSHGLLTRGFTTYGSLPNFPRIGGANVVEGYNSAMCGTCWELTYLNGKMTKNMMNILVIDKSPGFNIAREAMDILTNGTAYQLGRVNVTSKQISATQCQL